MMIAVLHFIKDAEAPVRTLLRALPPGSYFAVTHIASDLLPPDLAANFDQITKRSGVDNYARSREQLAELFEGLELVEPGIVPIAEWRDDRSERPEPQDIAIWGAIGRKP